MLDWSADLAAAAEAYSFDMCENGFFDHVDLQGRRIGDRLDNAGIYWVKSGENLAKGDGMLPEEADRMFMAEPQCRENHRGNTLDKDFTHTGVGVVFCGNTTFYTQIFATFDVLQLRSDENAYCTNAFQ
jgi:uncharacterized protein YkwD